MCAKWRSPALCLESANIFKERKESEASYTRPHKFAQSDGLSLEKRPTI